MPDNTPGATYTTFMVSRSRFRHNGLAQLPVAGDPPQACKFVALHAPYEEEIIQWVACRDGKPPECPDPYDLVQNDPNYILLDHQFGGMIPIILPGAGRRYEAWGWSRYGLQSPIPLQQGIKLGVTPFDPASPSDQFIPGDNFVGGIVDSSPSNPDIPPSSIDLPNQNPLQ